MPRTVKHLQLRCRSCLTNGNVWLLQDLAKDSAPHYKRARRFYDGLAEQLVRQGHALDVFACSLDQARPGAVHIRNVLIK